MTRFFNAVIKKFKPPIYKEVIKRMDMQSSLDLSGEGIRFKADITGGNLFISRSKQPNKAHIEVQWKEGCPKNLLPKFKYNSISRLIELEARGFSHFIGQREAYLINVYLPKEIPIDITMTAGVVYIDNMAGPLTASIAAGEILGYTCTHVINVNVGAGNIKLHGMQNNNAMSSIATKTAVKVGNVELVFNQLKAGDSIEASTLAGDVMLLLPPGTLSDEDILRKGHVKAKASVILNQVGASIRASAVLGDAKAYVGLVVPMQNDINDTCNSKTLPRP